MVVRVLKTVAEARFLETKLDWLALSRVKSICCYYPKPISIVICGLSCLHSNGKFCSWDWNVVLKHFVAILKTPIHFYPDFVNLEILSVKNSVGQCYFLLFVLFPRRQVLLLLPSYIFWMSQNIYGSFKIKITFNLFLPLMLSACTFNIIS